MKAQGMPINMIVMIVLALLVLVVVAGFFMTGTGTLFGGIAQQGGQASAQAELSAFRSSCQTWCMSMNSMYAPGDEIKGTLYCKTTRDLPSFGLTGVHCYNDNVLGDNGCRITLGNGQQVTITGDICENGIPES